MNYRLKECRKEKGYTQKQVADALGVDRVTYTNYENEKRDIPPALVVRLANFYKCTTDELLGSSYYYAYIAMRDER